MILNWSKKNPYLSFVISARNDDYGGLFLYRIKLFFIVLLHHIKHFQLSCEIIVVEWNPPIDKPRLYQELESILKTAPISIRFIEVPYKIHQQFSNASKMPIFEYIAKNVGVRRAKGKFILVTNPDIIFSEELIAYLSAENLDPRLFYRVDRYDIKGLAPFKASIIEQMEYAKTHAFRLHAFGQTVLLLSWLPFFLRSRIGYLSANLMRLYRKKEKHIEDLLHVNAAGDFFLMDRKKWHLLQGYPELPTHYLIDGYLCCLAKSSGLAQKILTLPLIIFHSEHNRPTSNRPKTLYADWRSNCQEMLTNKKPKIFNTNLWGLQNSRLIEYTINP